MILQMIYNVEDFVVCYDIVIVGLGLVGMVVVVECVMLGFKIVVFDENLEVGGQIYCVIICNMFVLCFYFGEDYWCGVGFWDVFFVMVIIYVLVVVVWSLEQEGEDVELWVFVFGCSCIVYVWCVIFVIGVME